MHAIFDLPAFDRKEKFRKKYIGQFDGIFEKPGHSENVPFKKNRCQDIAKKEAGTKKEVSVIITARKISVI